MNTLHPVNPVSRIPMPSIFNEHAASMISFTGGNLVLTGSLSLKLLGIPLNREVKNSDFDFALKRSFTEDEYLHFKDFFGLESNAEEIEKYNAESEGRDPVPISISEELENRLITLKKVIRRADGSSYTAFKMDIFNFDYLKDKDIIDITLKDTFATIPVAHPAVTISYKAKYAFQHMYGNYHKHFDDIKYLIENFTKYRRTIIPLWENRYHQRYVDSEGVIDFTPQGGNGSFL